jgi:lipid A 4'-phosphatase
MRRPIWQTIRRELSSPIAGIPLGWLVLFLTFANLMLAMPSLDLAVSGWLYTPGQGFTALGSPWERFCYHSVDVLMIAGNLTLVGLWFLNRRRRRRGKVALLGLDGRRLSLMLVLLALVPGLLVNQVLKEHWGRARPIQVTEFGGDRPFTPAFVYTGASGGSFCSGHVAAAAYVAAVARLLAGPRSLWFALAMLYTLFVGLARMAAGGHFASDVATAAFLVLFGYLVLMRLFYPPAHSRASPPH